MRGSADILTEADANPAEHAPWRALYPAGLAEVPDTSSTVLAMFRAAVARAPAAPALLYFDAVLDYAALDDLSDRLARHWRANGLTEGDRVAIILQNVPQTAIAALAAWKLGAIAVPLNPMYRVAELQKLFADCAPRAILCHGEHLDVVKEASAGLAPFCLLTTPPHAFQQRDDARVLPPREHATPANDMMATLCHEERQAACVSLPFHEATARDIALLLYTSGTTGVPKGVILTHDNLASNALVCRFWFGLHAGSRLFGAAPLFHITGFECNLCAAFCAGATLILTYRFAAHPVLDAFREHRPTFIIGAITAFVALMQAPDATAADFASLQRIYSGGAPIPPAVVERFARQFGKSIRTCYGMTETTAPTHLSPPDGAIPDDPDSGVLSIGIPAFGTEAMIVGEDGLPVPVGAAGELRVRGRQVMAGYWRKPAETAEVLVDGWMSTGDIGFRDEAGWFYLIDRKKDMICASGFKVWPREVEDVLYAFPGIREAAVIGEPDAYRGETVAAFVSLVAGSEAAPDDLIGHCRAHLAAYKVPRRLSVLADLPKTPSGKIMRAELRNPTMRIPT